MSTTPRRVRSVSLVLTAAVSSTLLTASGCRATASPDEVLGVLQQQQAGWNRGDIDAFLVGYEQSETITFAGASGLTEGLEAVRENYLTRYPDRDAMGTLTFSDLEITPLAPDAAYVIGRWQLERKNDSPGGIFTVIFRRTKDGWKIVHDHTSAFSAQ